MQIEELEWDEHNEEHIAGHGFTRVQLSDVIEGDYLLLRNRRDGSGDYRLVGRDRGGQLVTVVLRATAIPGRWRPITAWPSTPGEMTHARRNNI